jgi:predicted acylesterase/phospholipase RssA
LAAFISADPVRSVLAGAISASRIQQTSRRIQIAATNWRTGELRVFVNEDMIDDAHAVAMVLASSAIPGVFSSVEIDGEPFVDGGVVMNTPLRPAIHAGAGDLHVIYMDPDVRRIPLPRIRNSINTFHRLLVISFGLTVSRDIANARAINRRLRVGDDAAFTTALTGAPRPRQYRPLTIHRYHPVDDLGGTYRWLDFDGDHIHRLIERGYEDARLHDCELSRCVLPGQDESFSDEPPWIRRDA